MVIHRWMRAPLPTTRNNGAQVSFAHSVMVHARTNQRRGSIMLRAGIEPATSRPQSAILPLRHAVNNRPARASALPGSKQATKNNRVASFLMVIDLQSPSLFISLSPPVLAYTLSSERLLHVPLPPVFPPSFHALTLARFSKPISFIFKQNRNFMNDHYFILPHFLL